MEYQEVPYNPTKEKVNRVADALKHHDDVYVPSTIKMPAWLDGRTEPAVENLIVFRNGILDVGAYLEGEVKFLKPTPMLFTEQHCDYDFDPDALPLAQPFLDTLHSIFDGDAETIRLVQQWFGYNMVADTSMEKFMLMVGRPGAGKGTVLRMFREVVGNANVVDSTLADLGGQFGVGSLLGKLACIMADAHLPTLEASGRALEVIKTISGRDPIMVNQKHLSAFPAELPVRFTIAVNELPNLRDPAAALRRRLLLVHFPKTFRGREDTTLKDRLVQPEVIQGVAAWALQGLADLRQSGRFAMPHQSRRQIEAFEAKVSPIQFFAERCLAFEPDVSSPKADVRAAYEDARRLWNLRRMNESEFGQAFIAAFPDVETAKPGSRGGQVPHYMGVRVRPKPEWS